MCGRSGWEEKACNQYPKMICKGFVRNQGLKKKEKKKKGRSPLQEQSLPFLTDDLSASLWALSLRDASWFPLVLQLAFDQMLSPGPGAFSTVSENSSHRSLATSTMAKRLHPPHPVRCLGENTHRT